MSGLDDLAAFVSGSEANDISSAVRGKVQLHVIDIVGAWLAGLDIDEGKALARLRRDAPAGRFDDIVLNCAATRASEIDDIHLGSMTTPGSIVIPTALLLAVKSRNSADIVPAIVAGYEALVGFGMMINGPEVLYRGIWPTYFGASFGAAAVAARLLGLNAEQTKNALALAFTMGAPSVNQHHPPTTSRWLSVGLAARNGVDAAYAARAGFTSDTTVLQSRLLPDIFGIEPDLTKLQNGGDLRVMQVSMKPWCAARQTMPATQALREVLASGVVPSDITVIEAAVLPQHHKMIDHGVKPGDRGAHVTSLPYQMAVAALDTDRQFDLEQAPHTLPDEIAAFMTRVKITADPVLLDGYPAAWSARVVVTARGQRHERVVKHVPGDPGRPFTERDVAEKFRRLVGHQDGGNADALLKLVSAPVDDGGQASRIVEAIERAWDTSH